MSEDGSTVNLQVIDANGHAHARQDVPFIDGGAVGFSYAGWMPYQRAQHAKQETGSAAIGFVGTLVPDYVHSLAVPASAAPWYETEQATGGGAIDSVRGTEADGQEAPPAEDPAKASDPANSDDASAS